MLIGCGLWAVTLCHFDIHFAISALAQFNTAPREGHLNALLRIFGYLRAYQKAKIIFDTRPTYNNTYDNQKNNWHQLYPGATVELPPDLPKPFGKPVDISTYFDAGFANDLKNRRSVTGILLFVNPTPIKWYSKRQNTIETSTFGSELVAALIATELTMEIRYKLRMLVVPCLVWG